MHYRLFVLFVLALPIYSTSGDEAPTTLLPWKGKQRALVFLVEWKNQTAQSDVATIRRAFFGTGKSDGSLRQYFLENSLGKFDLTGEVLSWRRSPVEWKPEEGCRLSEIIESAWNVFGESVNVDDYDANKNGRVDHLFVIHSGRLPAKLNIKPKCVVTNRDPYSDFAAVLQSQGVRALGKAVPIGLYIHEGGHEYADSPDTYRRPKQGKYGNGIWDVMAIGSWGVNAYINEETFTRFPSHFSPLSKKKLGWVTPRIIKQSTKAIALRPVETTGDIVEVPYSARRSFFLEYRSPRGFSRNHPGHGLLIWNHTKLVTADGKDELNNNPPLGEADSPLPSETGHNVGDASDPFPGTENITEYDAGNGILFERITEHKDRVTLDIVIQSLDKTLFNLWKLNGKEEYLKFEETGYVTYLKYCGKGLIAKARIQIQLNRNFFKTLENKSASVAENCRIAIPKGAVINYLRTGPFLRTGNASPRKEYQIASEDDRVKIMETIFDSNNSLC